MAQEAFALLKTVEGTAQIDGREVKSAQLVKPGERLTLPIGGKVRVMLLGQSSETLLTGPLELKLNPKELKSKAQKIQREQIRVADSVGTRKPSAGAVVRAAPAPLRPTPTPSSDPVGLYPELPPRVADDGSGKHILSLGRQYPQERQASLFSDSDLELEIIDLDAPQKNFRVFRISFPAAEPIPDTIPLEQTLEQGRSYQLRAEFFSENGDPGKFYFVNFRLPTEEESLVLKGLEKKTRRGRGRVSALVELAETSLSLGQPYLALSALEQLKKIKTSKPNSVEFQQNYELVHRALEMRLP